MNLYAHFPFCRRKCAYCALHSRAGATEHERRDYVAALVQCLAEEVPRFADGLSTVYFGGGSPALCDLAPLLAALAPYLKDTSEFTVELHPLDVTDSLLCTLVAGGVNRISMGVQSLDDTVLRQMGRAYTVDDAARAFARIKTHIANAGIDLIVGYPKADAAGHAQAEERNLERLADWGLTHCSVYSLILEERSILARQIQRGLSPPPPDDDAVLDEIRWIAAALKRLGLDRYEISNYARSGQECRHNLATWRGEDYLGLGDGACGRLGLTRTRGCLGKTADGKLDFSTIHTETETVTSAQDEMERRLFQLRTRDGLDPAGHSAWLPVLDRFVADGLLTKAGSRYRLTERGTEVCDSILVELMPD